LSTRKSDEKIIIKEFFFDFSLLCGERSNIGLQQGEKLFIRALFLIFFKKKSFFFFPKKQEYTTMQNETQKT